MFFNLKRRDFLKRRGGIFQLDCIRRCGHTHQFFFLELGRSAITGSGSLWLQVEDMVISQNIHEALLRFVTIWFSLKLFSSWTRIYAVSGKRGTFDNYENH